MPVYWLFLWVFMKLTSYSFQYEVGLYSMQFDIYRVMADYQKSIFKSVLQVGEQHVNFRGGIGAVLATYKLYFPFFKSVGSHWAKYCIFWAITLD
jgi:hypothetical protein